MKREKLEEFLGSNVSVIFNDGDSVSGVLTKGYGYHDGYYQCNEGVWFRCSHVKKVNRAVA